MSKENINKKALFWTIVIVLITIGLAFVIYNYVPGFKQLDINQQCEKNPEECVCKEYEQLCMVEEWGDSDIIECWNESWSNSCLKWRFKTEEEKQNTYEKLNYFIEIQGIGTGCVEECIKENNLTYCNKVCMKYKIKMYNNITCYNGDFILDIGIPKYTAVSAHSVPNQLEFNLNENTNISEINIDFDKKIECYGNFVDYGFVYENNLGTGNV